MRISVEPMTRLLGVARLGFAVPSLVTPQRIGRGWMGVDRPWLRPLMLVIGVRDVVLGVGLLSRGRSRRALLLASAAADTGDAIGSLIAAIRLRSWRPAAVAVLAASGAAAGVGLAALDARSGRLLG